MKKLQITDGSIYLPIDYVGMVCAVLAQRRKGKTYTASVMAEELVKCSLPFVVLDPTGAWWGLRSSADGMRPGLPVRIIGGQHGDLPLEREAGRFIADLVLDSPGYYVLDMSLLGSRAAEREFATDFADRLHRRKMQPGMDFPLHLFVDEADLFVPQEREDKGDVRMLGAFQAIVRRGGLHGLGVTLISQRPALVNKSVLTQLDVLILLRLVAGQDQDAVDKSYISRNSTPEQRKEVMASLASMRVGDAWLWEPGADPPLIELVHIRERHTFNSSATPKPGEKRVEPKVWADVELAALQEAMQESIERAKADDPAELRKLLRERDREIERLGKELANQPDPEPVVERVEVPVFDKSLLVELDEALSRIYAGAGAALEEALTPTFKELLHIRGMTEASRAQQDVPRTRPAGNGAGAVAHRPRQDRPAQRPDPPAGREPRGASVPRPASDVKLGGPERKILSVLATYGQCSKQKLALLAGYSAGGGGFNNPLSRLRTAGFVEGTSELVITAAGVDALGPVEPLPTGPALLSYWLNRFGHAEREILRVLADFYPGSMGKEALAASTMSTKGEPYSPDAGGFNNPLSRLRTIGLVMGSGSSISLSPDLGEQL